MRSRSSNAQWHARVWRLSTPVILANLSPPLVGLADTAVMGRMPDASYIAAVAVGATATSSLYWLFGFLRMGTTARVAQALGADDSVELQTSCLRAAALAMAVAAITLAVAPMLLFLAERAFASEPEVDALSQAYLRIRLLGLPAYLLQLVFIGTLFGMQRMTLAMLLMMGLNGMNLILDLTFVIGFGWGVEGVAWGTVLSEWLILVVTVPLVARLIRVRGPMDWMRFWQPAEWQALFGMSRDLFIRTFFVQLPFLVNAALAARLGSAVLAGNAILMQFFFVGTFALDGVAHAAESLAGYAVGRNDRDYLRKTLGYCGFWAVLFALMLSLFFAAAADPLIQAMTNIESVATSAKAYFGWIVALPVLGVSAFLFDGLFIGAGAARQLRNAMIKAAIAYLATVALTLSILGNTALWLGMAVFMLTRSIVLAQAYPALATQLSLREA